MVFHKQLLIEGSGLVQILTENKFSMIGLSAVVGVNNMKRARHTSQVTLCTLFIQLREAASVSETDLSPFPTSFRKKTLSGVLNNGFGSNP